ncbi:hypothetical protein KAR91_02380 [Candidatus Pacearchaeota archaeon]|nr:hypothetical protein [Candidatus Pacearchaeota archaeon]
MKELFILFIVTISLLSCTTPTSSEIIQIEPEEEITEEPQIEINPLIGQWLKHDQVVQFYDTGDFRFYDYYTLEEQFYGFYIDDRTSVYLEDPVQNASMIYEYTIVAERGNIILRWKSEGMINTTDYILID